MIKSVSSRRSTSSTESGQATFEFVLAVILIIVTLSALYQALHFELDAFNKISLLRYRIMKEAHAGQPDVPKSFPTEPADFRPLNQLTPVLLMTQYVDPTLQYGPKSFRYRIGTKYAEPLPISAIPTNPYGIALLMQIGDYSENGFKYRQLIGPAWPVWTLAYPDPFDQ